MISDKTTTLTAPDTDLERDLIDVVNRHIQARRLHPQRAAETTAVMAVNMLQYLAWKPQHVQAAESSLRDAVDHMRAG